MAKPTRLLLLTVILFYVAGVAAGCAVAKRFRRPPTNADIAARVGGVVINFPGQLWIGGEIADTYKLCFAPTGLLAMQGPTCLTVGEIRAWIAQPRASTTAWHLSPQVDSLLVTDRVTEQGRNAVGDPAFLTFTISGGGAILISGDEDLPLIKWLQRRQRQRLALELVAGDQ